MRTGEARPDRSKLIRGSGYEGTAEPVAALDEEETFHAAKAPTPAVIEDEHVGETTKSALQDHVGEVIAELGDPAAQGLSLYVKLGMGGLILAACYGWVRAHGPRAGRVPAGRHGAYEKSGQV